MTNVGTMSTQVADRVRDPNFEGTTQANVISLLSYSQQVVNGVLGDVTGSASLVLQPRTPIYQLSSVLTSAVKIQAVRDASGRDLEPIPFEALSWLSMKWFTAVSDYPRGFATAGRDLLIIFPAVRTAQTVTVVYSNLTATLNSTGQTTAVPNEDDDAVYDLAEALLLLKNRDMPGCKMVIERFSQRIKELANESR